ncbi:gas vesicle protein [Krasilnikoviella flava]|uniref:Gas vesicle protein n=1 Tax=Krasilnikoviella flava TaxID=526729 RepID=A0A1T5L7Y7_9MICO|nr:gas vesicle protein [Krasilnikoviella flava]SKC72063.1 Gas vesicle protein [Krasilnikoviella flava]
MTEPSAAVAPPQHPQGGLVGPALQPTRDLGATLPDLLDALLDKGVYLDLDLIVTVAGIPLIGVNLRAAVAGVETMLEHGMMRGWDEQTRAWVRESLARNVPLSADEEVVARMPGGHRRDAPPGDWRPGTVYLTSRRLLVWRADPREMLWQAALEDIIGIDLRTERSVGGEDRDRLAVTTRAETALLSVAAPGRLMALLREHGPDAPTHAPELRAQVWYLEERRGAPAWRGGTGTLGPGGLTWQGAGDVSPAVRAREIRTVQVRRARTPVGRQVLLVSADEGTVRLATRDAAWARALTSSVHEHSGGDPCH